MKLVALSGIIVGLIGSVLLAIIGMQDVENLGSETSGYHNGLLLIKYGSAFSLIFLVTLRLMNKQYWKTSLIIGFLCTAFSILGLFSIGPFTIWGSIFILIFSLINLIRLRTDNK